MPGSQEQTNYLEAVLFNHKIDRLKDHVCEFKIGDR